ncbi:MAG: hypothetical protein Q7Q71_01865 [Verrucomicrobiota bacterium JB023]|nr:hypothetical protein [Verrucomicrobiota bacterium JB023]
MNSSRFLFLSVGVVLLSMIPWFWSLLESRTLVRDSPRAQYMNGLSSICFLIGAEDWGSAFWHEGKRIREGSVYLDYSVVNQENVDVLLDAARDASTVFGDAGTWGTSQNKDLDAKKILRFRVPEEHQRYYKDAIDLSQKSFLERR